MTMKNIKDILKKNADKKSKVSDDDQTPAATDDKKSPPFGKTKKPVDDKPSDGQQPPKDSSDGDPGKDDAAEQGDKFGVDKKDGEGDGDQDKNSDPTGKPGDGKKVTKKPPTAKPVDPDEPLSIPKGKTMSGEKATEVDLDATEDDTGETDHPTNDSGGNAVKGNTVAESIDAAGRARRAASLRRSSGMRHTGSVRNKASHSDLSHLKSKAARMARREFRKRILRGRHYSDLPNGTKAYLDSKMSEHKDEIDALADRLLPKIKVKEMDRSLGHGKYKGSTLPQYHFSAHHPKNKKVSTKPNTVTEEDLLEIVNSLHEEQDYEITEAEMVSLQNKACDYQVPIDVLESVFRRGISAWEMLDESNHTFQQYAFNRVNSFLSGGTAADMDTDLLEWHEGKFHRLDAAEKVARREFKRYNPLLRARRSVEAARLGVNVAELPNTRGGIREEVLQGGGTHNRTSMPQIRDMDAFKKDLKNNGHSIETSKHEPTSLKPTQKHYDPKKVKKFLKRSQKPSKKPIIITKSNHIIDGHHRWQAHRESDTKVKAHQVSMHVGELMRFLKNKPYVKTAGLREENNNDD